MDIFEKCEKRSRVDEAKELGIYPYFHALESRQDTVAASCPKLFWRGLRQVLPSPCPWRGRYAFGPAWDESWSAQG